tara:strand:+ start:2585 stop:3301 length:717 start_codon:yes stop_codon:yes gene_type:complete
MSKKLLSEAQVRKFMGLANLDANVSSNFINEMYHEEIEEEGLNLGAKPSGKEPKGEDPHAAARQKDEGMHKEDMHAEGAHEEAELEVDAEGGDEGEEAEEAADVDVMLSQDEVEDAMAELDNAHKKLSDLLGKLMGAEADLDKAEDEPEELDLDVDVEDEIELQEKHGAMKGDESATHKGEEDYTTKKGDELKHSGKGRGEKKGDKAYINEEEIVQEVAKRVAQRINDAARAQKKTDK